MNHARWSGLLVVCLSCNIAVVAGGKWTKSVPKSKQFPKVELTNETFCDFSHAVSRSDPTKYSDGYTLFMPDWKSNADLIDMNGQVVHRWMFTDGKMNSKKAELLENGNLLRLAHKETMENFVFYDQGGYMQEIDWDGNIVHECQYMSNEYMSHHDLIKVGNSFIFPAWKLKKVQHCEKLGLNTKGKDKQEGSYAIGHSMNRKQYCFMDGIIEMDVDTCEIVWEWWHEDHLVQDYDSDLPGYGKLEDHPEKIDFNYGYLGDSTHGVQPESLHINAVDYNPTLKQIMITSMSKAEIYIIDHTTTTEEAAGSTGGAYGKGGDLLYRWGNARNYNRGWEHGGNQHNFKSHNGNWIKEGLPGAGNIMWFDNGFRGIDNIKETILPDYDYFENLDSDSMSSIMWSEKGSFNQYHGMRRLYAAGEEFTPAVNEDGTYRAPEDEEAYLPTNLTWSCSFRDWSCDHYGSTQRLPNGNSVMTCGFGSPFNYVDPDGGLAWTIRETTPDCEVVWQFTNPYPSFITENDEISSEKEVGKYNSGRMSAPGLFRSMRYPASYEGFSNVTFSPCQQGVVQAKTEGQIDLALGKVFLLGAISAVCTVAVIAMAARYAYQRRVRAPMDSYIRANFHDLEEAEDSN